MAAHKFKPEKLAKLNRPERLEILPPEGVLEAVGLLEARVLVDIGAGTGLFSKAFLKLLPEARCHALDIAPEMVDWMMTHIPEAEEGRLLPALMEESKTSLKDGVADGVFMIALLHELENPVAMLAECLRILRPGGRLFVADWAKERGEHGPPKDHLLPAASILSHLRQAGFRDAEPKEISSDMVCFAGGKAEGDGHG